MRTKSDADKKRAIFDRPYSAYNLLRNLAPAKPKDKSYTKLVGILKNITVRNRQRRYGFFKQRSQYLPFCRSYALSPNFAILAQR